MLLRYPYALEVNTSALLLLARAQKQQNKVEAIDNYAKWSISSAQPSPQGLYEYAQILEDAGFNAKALEEYKVAMSALTNDTGDLKRSTLRFHTARLLLRSDPENWEGIMELSNAVNEGFTDISAMEELLLDEQITPENRDEVRRLITTMQKVAEEESSGEEAIEEESPEEDTW